MGRVEFDAAGRPLKLRGIIKDITVRKQTEIALREKERQFRATFEQAAIGLLHTSPEGRILHCNPRFAEMIGYYVDEVSGVRLEDITAADDREKSNTALKRMTAAAAQVAPPSTWEKRAISARTAAWHGSG